jgi:hypothetical protein
VIEPEHKNKTSVAYTRYADNQVAEDKDKHFFEFPKGKPLRRINTAGELFKMQKPSNHW